MTGSEHSPGPQLQAQHDRKSDCVASSTETWQLLESLRIAAVFLDREGRLCCFTSAAADFLPLRHDLLGRPLSEAAGPIELSHLATDLEVVFRTGTSTNREILTADGRTIFRSPKGGPVSDAMTFLGPDGPALIEPM